MLPGRIGAIARWILESYPAPERAGIIDRIDRRENIKRALGPFEAGLTDTQGHTLFGFLRGPNLYLSESWMRIRANEGLVMQMRGRLETATISLPDIIEAAGIPHVKVLGVRTCQPDWCELELADLRHDWRPLSPNPSGLARSPRNFN